MTSAALALALVGVELAAQVPAASPYPPTGKLVDVGGYRVHLNCQGEGSPTVAIVGAGFSIDWGLVQPQVSKFTRVCTYDPAGNAWSDPGPGQTCPERVDEIHKLLGSAGIEGPYVLAGLSFGALVARSYALKYSNDVAGMVIVDHAFLNPGSGASRGEQPSTSGLDRPPMLLEQTPIVLTTEDTSQFNKLPKRDQDLHRWAASRHPVRPTAETAEQCLVEVEAAARESPVPLGSIPLVVVSTANESPN